MTLEEIYLKSLGDEGALKMLEDKRRAEVEYWMGQMQRARGMRETKTLNAVNPGMAPPAKPEMIPGLRGGVRG